MMSTPDSVLAYLGLPLWQHRPLALLQDPMLPLQGWIVAPHWPAASLVADIAAYLQTPVAQLERLDPAVVVTVYPRLPRWIWFTAPLYPKLPCPTFYCPLAPTAEEKSLLWQQLQVLHAS